jgi:hypothetical protein
MSVSLASRITGAGATHPRRGYLLKRVAGPSVRASSRSVCLFSQLGPSLNLNRVGMSSGQQKQQHVIPALALLFERGEHGEDSGAWQRQTTPTTRRTSLPPGVHVSSHNMLRCMLLMLLAFPQRSRACKIEQSSSSFPSLKRHMLQYRRARDRVCNHLSCW